MAYERCNLLRLGVIASQRGAGNRERALEESLGFVEVALLRQQIREVGERDGYARVLRAEGLFGNCKASLVESLGLVVLALLRQQTSEMVRQLSDSPSRESSRTAVART